MLNFTDHPSHLTTLRTAALQAVNPAAAVQRSLTLADFEKTRRIFIVGAGKAGVSMTLAAAETLGTSLTNGILAVPQAPASAPERVTFLTGGHPLPDEGSLAAGQAIADLLAQTTSDDLVLALISGGGSALLELLRPGVSLADLQATNAALLKCGAPIHEINRVRQRLSRIKGGGLARMAYPARVLSLILSDVVGNPLEIIASGPTVRLPCGGEAARLVVESYRLREQLPRQVIQTIETDDTPDEYWPQVENRLIASNYLAGEAAAQAAQDLGFQAEFIGDDWQGEARQMAAKFAQILLARTRRPTCLIAGGETTVTVRGNGKGGRNQEAALAAVQAIAGQRQTIISTFATDGVDGPTDAAGATVTGETMALAQANGLEPQTFLDDNDAYNFFDQVGGLIRSGPSGTNVNDLIFGLRY